MKSKKIRLMKENLFTIILFTFGCLLSIPFILVAIFNKEIIILMICILYVFIFYLPIYMSSIYGIKITDKYILFKTENKKKKILIEDIYKVETFFMKKKKHYKVMMKVLFKKSKHQEEFLWDEIYMRRLGEIKTIVTTKNIDRYIQTINNLEKFVVYPVK